MSVRVCFFAGVMACASFPAVAEDSYQYNWITGSLGGTPLIAANVVRAPAFIGLPAERDQAIGQVLPVLHAEYCQNKGMQFVVDPGLVVFDKGLSEWLVGGVCR